METSDKTPGRGRKPPYCILLIDDDQDIVEAFASGLTAEGHYVHATTHGDDLLRLASQFDPDVLIADMIMEGVDTLDVIAALRRSHPNIKIIAISGNPHLLTLALKHGADHTLAKPFRASETESADKHRDAAARRLTCPVPDASWKGISGVRPWRNRTI